ncbi:TetR/AcrR family transcriptional regulator [Antrihabitans cavernicola]|uniref:TetR/AcrR family transcriptional regulator n=1 Tax=Antrihabitans cavernicola TaxID=2495913 RepID=A0A5A7S4P0_9NOCA|nr:TetR/AcrR family transcriptional regulator [Spelaeibacter cavernicola]KAA0021138.1 TetR/AcrR family transcriptional regulator [Spelaeibacter cavernicola]
MAAIGSTRTAQGGPTLTARGAATRARIIEAAADLVFQQGVSATTLDDVMAASGTSKSQLYHYFADKDALTNAVVVRETERVLDAQDHLLRDANSLAGLRAWAAAIVEFHRERRGVGGCPIGSLAGELSDSSEDARLLLQAGFAMWEDRIRAVLDAMHGTGELRADAVTADLAAAILTALQGGLLLTQTTHLTRHLELGLQMALEHVALECNTGHRHKKARQSGQ